MPTFPVIVRAGPGDLQGRAAVATEAATVRKEIDVTTLKRSFEHLTRTLSDVLAEARTVGEYRLKQVDVRVEITSEGGVSLIGTATVGSTAALTLIFERG